MGEHCNRLGQQFGWRGVHEVEAVQIQHPTLLHPQQHIGQIGVPDLGLDQLHPLEVQVAVEAKTFARPGSSGTAGTLNGGCLGDWANQQGFKSTLWIKLCPLTVARINHIDDTVNCLFVLFS